MDNLGLFLRAARFHLRCYPCYPCGVERLREGSGRRARPAATFEDVLARDVRQPRGRERAHAADLGRPLPLSGEEAPSVGSLHATARRFNGRWVIQL
jgi:hypothetical protein